MLWMVTQTATTLSTGDHSLPRMEAHICMETGVRARFLEGILVTRRVHGRSSTHAAGTGVACAQGRQHRVAGRTQHG